MPEPFRKRRLSFQAKVLIPVVAIMVILVVATILMVNRRITDEFQIEAAQKLSVAAGVFNNSQKIRTRNLLFRYRNVPREPRCKAVLQTGDPKTVRVFLGELLKELGGEISFFTTDQNLRLAEAYGGSPGRESDLSASEFADGSATSVKRATEGQPNVETILVGTRLFDVVSIPVTVGDNTIGVLSFGVEIGQSVAEEFKQLTHAEVVFRANGGVIASTLLKRHLQKQLMAAFAAGQEPVRQLQLDGEHFLAVSGQFVTQEKEKNLGYILLSSYEQSLSVLQSTQRMLALISLLGIALSTGVVWVLIRRITQPLRELRDSAEAVGKGDFSRRVQVASRDECGELAGVFNQMTENLKSSREELEKNVETLKAMQAQLIQSEKLSAIGEFVAGIAHELNNPLTSVVGFAELLQQSDVNERHRRFLELIVQSAQRCHKIVQSLLSFARQHKPERKPINLHEVVEASVAILQYQLRTNNIHIITRFDPQLPKVLGDPHQLQQVFVNLINNARQAIEACRPRGLICITTETCPQGVRISFQDDGPGIASENLAKIFNPFFTTKDVGKGTGLGLSLSYGFIKEHGGSITVESAPGKGATFVIELPVAPEGAATAAPAGSSGPRASVDARGKKVLVIDDEELILHFVQESLAPINCHVDVAGDGETALRLLRQSHYDLTICDWKMPGMSGRQLYEQIHRTDPAAASRFMFITGDIMNDKVQSFLQDTGKICLSKPFSVDDFRSAIGTALKAA
jgi:two-component system, NtrC family, sensor kinase